VISRLHTERDGQKLKRIRFRDRTYPRQTVQLGADDHGCVEGVVGEHDSEDTSWTTGEKGRRQARL
jgi:hypothetical protein